MNDESNCAAMASSEWRPAMTDPLSPTPLSEEERLHFTNLREAWRRAAPVYTDIAATDVEWLCTLIDRLSPGVAEPPTPCRHSIYHSGCSSCDRQDPEDRE